MEADVLFRAVQEGVRAEAELIAAAPALLSGLSAEFAGARWSEVARSSPQELRLPCRRGRTAASEAIHTPGLSVFVRQWLNSVRFAEMRISVNSKRE
ncbi:hypothetical protein ACIGJO_24880 [Streptomyces sp. NPDC079020]|uniref:hypothetical protein n=1 Tax=Streptomyces sp. NPDC079020 TaxID=3365722 RepID=UPI0037D3DC50